MAIVTRGSHNDNVGGIGCGNGFTRGHRRHGAPQRHVDHVHFLLHAVLDSAHDTDRGASELAADPTRKKVGQGSYPRHSRAVVSAQNGASNVGPVTVFIEIIVVCA